MKEVIVQPERCVGCMQCMIACATAHSQTKQLYTAVWETPLPKSRVHVGAGLYNEGVSKSLPTLQPCTLYAGLSRRRDFSRYGDRFCPDRSGSMHQLRFLCHGLPVRRHTIP